MRASLFPFYLPASIYPKSALVCQIIADEVQEIIDALSKDVVIEGSRYLGERHTDIREATFTGRIFVYHEVYLTENEIDALNNYYRQKGYNPIFRGPKYLMLRSQYEK